MTIYKSQQVNLDKEPYLFQGHRYRADQVEGIRRNNSQRNAPAHVVYDPRPEFEPTRDPFPWAVVYLDGSVHDYRADNLGPLEPGERFEFRPRREQFDTPVNRMLVAFREDCADPDFEVNSVVEYAQAWLNNTPGIDVDWDTFDLDEIDHARRVLTRLANWKEQ